MIFNSLEFLVFFLIFFLVYFATNRRKIQSYVTLFASLFFYGWWDWRFLSLIFVYSIVTYSVGLKIENSTEHKTRKRLLVFCIVFTLGILCFFKYFNFFADSLTHSLHMIGFNASYSVLQIILPIGISFYTFETMSYVIDIYKRHIKAEKDFIIYFLFVTFFPHLVAGPIIRPSYLLPQFKILHKIDYNRFILGFAIILFGFFKKVVVADSIAPLVDNGFLNYNAQSSLNMLLIVFLYAIQIYGDFSGYSDIAIGIAKIMGYDFPANFNRPYFSQSFSEFWKRWHISLSSWLRDYLYISLGGNRNGNFNTYKNLMLTMILGGLWHGANWTFVFWGFLHGFYLILQRLFEPVNKLFIGNVYLKGIHSAVSVITVFLLVCFAWVFFRSRTFGEAFAILNRIAAFEGMSFSTITPLFNVVKVMGLIGILFLVEWLSLIVSVPKLLLEKPALRYSLFSTVIYLILLFGTYSENQFIYFQF